jgi:hypothetical protein
VNQIWNELASRGLGEAHAAAQEKAGGKRNLRKESWIRDCGELQYRSGSKKIEYETIRCFVAIL